MTNPVGEHKADRSERDPFVEGLYYTLSAAMTATYPKGSGVEQQPGYNCMVGFNKGFPSIPGLEGLSTINILGRDPSQVSEYAPRPAIRLEVISIAPSDGKITETALVLDPDATRPEDVITMFTIADFGPASAPADAHAKAGMLFMFGPLVEQTKAAALATDASDPSVALDFEPLDYLRTM